jgi:hypothetical protein
VRRAISAAQNARPVGGHAIAALLLGHDCPREGDRLAQLDAVTEMYRALAQNVLSLAIIEQVAR